MKPPLEVRVRWDRFGYLAECCIGDALDNTMVTSPYCSGPAQAARELMHDLEYKRLLFSGVGSCRFVRKWLYHITWK